MNDIWWDLGQTLIWIATRDLGWVAELQPRVNRVGMPEKRDPFGYDFAAAALQHDVIGEFKQGADPDAVFRALMVALQSEEITAVEAGTAISASQFAHARVGDHYASTAYVGELVLYRLDATPAHGPVLQRDAVTWRPTFLAEQVQHAFPAIASQPAPISVRGRRFLEQVATPRFGRSEGIVTNDTPTKSPPGVMTAPPAPALPAEPKLTPTEKRIFTALVGAHGQGGGAGLAKRGARLKKARDWAKAQNPIFDLREGDGGGLERAIQRLDAKVWPEQAAKMKG